MAEYEPKKIVQPRRRECVDEVELQAAADMIQEAKKPYIFVGGGAVLSDAAEELLEFAKKVDAPVADS